MKKTIQLFIAVVLCLLLPSCGGENINVPESDSETKEEFLIKRVIGLPGDTIELLNGNVYVNEAVYDESAYLDVRTIKTLD